MIIELCDLNIGETRKRTTITINMRKNFSCFHCAREKTSGKKFWRQNPRERKFSSSFSLSLRFGEEIIRKSAHNVAVINYVDQKQISIFISSPEISATQCRADIHREPNIVNFSRASRRINISTVYCRSFLIHSTRLALAYRHEEWYRKIMPCTLQAPTFHLLLSLCLRIYLWQMNWLSLHNMEWAHMWERAIQYYVREDNFWMQIMSRRPCCVCL